MKKFFILVVLLFMLPATAFADESMTVFDYYMLLPYNYLQREMVPERAKGIEIKDIKNGYLKITGPFEGFIEVALFKTANGGNLIGLIKSSCGPGCEQERSFLEYKYGKWMDKTKDVLPNVPQSLLASEYKKKRAVKDPANLEEVPVLYMLPRYGTSIKIIAQPEFTSKEIVLVELKFNKTKFVLPGSQ